MRSSEAVNRMTALIRLLPVAVSLLHTACSAPPAASQTASTTGGVECVAAQGGASPQNPETTESLRRAVEMGPLYTILASQSGVASCRVSNDSSEVTLEYSFRDGGSLQARRDPRIEYNNQEARFAMPPAEDPVAVLTRAEHLAFVPDGCGIDWRTPETQPSGDDPSTTETIYRGDVCNCQARVRRDMAGRVMRLLLRSAC